VPALREASQIREAFLRFFEPIPVHLQEAFAELGHGRGDFPAAEAAAEQVLSLPMFPEITSDQQEAVVTAIRAWSEAR